jgi:hypothetical protein
VEEPIWSPAVEPAVRGLLSGLAYRRGTLREGTVARDPAVTCGTRRSAGAGAGRGTVPSRIP